MTENVKKNEKAVGDYSGDEIRLSQDQMLGIGGGSKYYEILEANPDGSFRTRLHVAMPALLKHRPFIKSGLRRHAEAQIEVTKMISENFDFKGVGLEEFNDNKEAELNPVPDLEVRIEECQARDTDALLELAYYCFIRTDPALKGKTVEEGKLILGEWLDENQLKTIPETAMGTNKFERPQGGAGLSKTPLR